MDSEVVVGIDCSTTATKAIAWDYSGKNIAQAGTPVRLSSPRANYYEQDPGDWWHSLKEALQILTRQVRKDRISAVSVSNQRETFVGLDKEGEPVRPAIIWLDERCKSQVDKFAAVIGDDRIHRITGKPKDYAPVVYRLAWMKEEEKDLYRKVVNFCDVHTFIVNKLTGHFKTSWASADPLGIFDLEKKIWSPEIIRQLGIIPGQLPVALPPGTVLGHVTSDAANASGLMSGTPVIAGGGDGQAAGTGVNALSPGRAYLNLGTAVVSGTFTKNYLTERSFRTLACCAEEGYYCETSLRSGTFLTDWFINQILKIEPERKQDIYVQLEKEAQQIEPGSEGLMVLPYWNAVMNPYWDPDARGSIVGFTSAHNRGHLFRAILEGIAMEQSLATKAVEKATGERIKEFAVTGGGAKSDLWRQIIADISGKEVLTMLAGEASSLGAGISAAVGAGWFSSFAEAAKNMVHVRFVTKPDSRNTERYHSLMDKYKVIYPSIKDIFRH